MDSKSDILNKIDNLLKVGSLDANLFNKEFVLNRVNEFMTIRNENPNFHCDDICKQMGTSSNVMRRYFSDLKMNSPFKHIQPKPSKNKERVRYSYQDGSYVRDKQGEYVYNVITKSFIDFVQPLTSISIKTRIDNERNNSVQSINNIPSVKTKKKMPGIGGAPTQQTQKSFNEDDIINQIKSSYIIPK